MKLIKSLLFMGLLALNPGFALADEEQAETGVTAVIAEAAPTEEAVPAVIEATEPAPAPVAEAVPAPAPTPNKGDVAWMLTSTALVLMMSVPALALFYGGLVR